MDAAAIFTEVTRRHALRREAGLPLLNLRQEVEHGVALARSRDYRRICVEHQDLLEDIRAQVVDELLQIHGRDFRLTMDGCWAIEARTQARFEAVLAEKGLSEATVPSPQSGDRRWLAL